MKKMISLLMLICLSVACLAGCVPTAKKKIADKIAQDEQVDGVEDEEVKGCI